MAPYVAPDGTWGDYSTLNGVSCADVDPNSCDTGASALIRSCSVTGACTGKYLSCRKLIIPIPFANFFIGFSNIFGIFRSKLIFLSPIQQLGINGGLGAIAAILALVLIMAIVARLFISEQGFVDSMMRKTSWNLIERD